jgi:two-component system cell cycle sensor histidine kinase/response regulator CckA
MGNVEKTAEQLELEGQFNRSLLEAVPGGVVHVGINGRVHSANLEAQRVLGMSYDELTDRYTTDWELETIYEDGSPCLADDYPVTKALMTGQPQPSVTIGVRRPDGEISWALFSALPLKGSDGAATGAIVTFLDVTERKRLDDARRDSEATLQSLVRSAPDVIVTADLDCKIQFINRVIEGFDISQVIGTSIFDYIAAADHEMVRAKIKCVLERGENVSYELRGSPPEDLNWWSTQLGPVERDGKVVGFTGVSTNITALRRGEEERKRLRAQLSNARHLEALGRLSGGVAHDFNNLLTIIQGGVDLLARRLVGTSHADGLTQIGDAVQKAALLTRQLLAFGRQQTLQPRRLDLNQLVTGVEDMLRRLVREDVELVLELSDGIGVVRADPLELERVMLNLAANARDAMPEGGTLTIRSKNQRVTESDELSVPAREYVCLEVTDTGMGIDEATRARIFEPFFSTKGDGEGTGLGLASVHGIVKQSGGHVLVTSVKGEGTTFSILLPRLREHATMDPPPRAESKPPSGEGTVLLVEDNAAVRAVTRQILQAAGYRVLVADDGVEALERFATEELTGIDMLITDVVMPHLSGPKLAEALLARSPGLRVLFVSGHTEHEVQIHGLKKDLGFLAKPYTAETLTKRVRNILTQ